MSILTVNNLNSPNGIINLSDGVKAISVEEPFYRGSTTFAENYTVASNEKIVSIGTVQLGTSVTVTVNGTWRFV